MHSVEERDKAQRARLNQGTRFASVSPPGAGYGSKPMASVQERLEAQRAGLYQARAPPWENGSLQYHHQALVMTLSPWLQYRSVLRPNGPDCISPGHRPGKTVRCGSQSPKGAR